ncbi:MAG: glycosyltransferase [Bryobacterales bacterium]|nr:glycosyltransferase [Bryobacterales bacterium]
MPSPLRFCLVTTYYPPYHFGGDAVFTQCLARALAARGHSVDVIHCEDAFRIRAGAAPVAAAEAGETPGVTVHRLRSRWGSLSPLITQQTGRPGVKRGELQRLLQQQPFDVVNFHNISLVGGPGVLALAQAPAVRIYTLHEHWLLCPTHIFWKNNREACQARECFRCSLRSGLPPQLWRYTKLIQRSLHHVDALLSPSAFTARQHEAAGIGGIRLLPTYTDLPAGECDYVPPARPRFVFAGRVTASKGVNQLVETFSRLPQYDLDIVGTGDLLEPLRQRYSQCGWIRFHGHARHAAMLPHYRHATAMILPSLAPEVFPLCVLEAFACATPAIVRNAGGAPEAVEASGAGFVFRHEVELLEAVHRLAGEADLRRRLGARARAAYLERYTEEHYMNGYLDIVNELRHAKQREGRTQ